MKGRVLRGSHPRLISDAPSGLRDNGIREFLTFQTASKRFLTATEARHPTSSPGRDLCCGLPTLVTQRAGSASGITAVRTGSEPTTRVVCPRPVVSSTSRASPGPKRRRAPSPRPISSWPARIMTYCRRGAGCQSMNVPTGICPNTIWAAACGVVRAGCALNVCSSICDCLSFPV